MTTDADTTPQDEPITYRTEVFQALGMASMCWSETPRGVFESERAAEIGNRLVALHEAELRAVYGGRDVKLAMEAARTTGRAEAAERRPSRGVGHGR